MPEPPRSERIKPCLLDRLTDDHPSVTEESRMQRVVPPERYLKAVLRDLLWLFNVRTHSLDTAVLAEDPVRASARRRGGGGLDQRLDGTGDRVIADFPEVSRSVLTFGIHDLTGVLSAQLVVTQLCRDLEETVRFFEPRINPKTLRVKPVLGDGGRPDKPTATSICFELLGDVWMEPIPEHLHLKTVIDLETGQCELLDAAHEPKVS